MKIQCRWHRWCIPLVATMTVAMLPAVAQTPIPDMGTPNPYQTMKLDNGLDIIVVENHNVPLVTIDIAVRNGAFTEPDEFAGLSHLYEHMFFKANAALTSQEQFMKRVRELGISFNGYTSEEIVTYFFTLPSRNLEPGVRFMADAIKTPLFKDEELTKEREVVLGEFDRNEAQPTFNLRYAIDSAMWMPYVSRKQALGQRQVIKTATVEKMRMIQNRFYVPNNSALIVSGDVKSADVFALAKKYLSDWKRGADPFPQYNPPVFPPLQSKLVVREARIPEASVQMVFRGPSVLQDDPAPYVAAVISTILRQQTSRFYHNLNDSGIVTDSYVGFNSARNVSDLVFDMDVSPAKAHHAVDQLKQELKAMARPGYFSPEEITTAKKIIADRSIFEQDNPMRFTIGTTARWWSMASLDYYLNFPMNAQRVTESDITNFVNHYLVGQPFVLGVGADKKSLDQLNFTEGALTWK